MGSAPLLMNPVRDRGTMRTRSPWLAKMTYDKKKIPNRGLNKVTDECMESHYVLTCICYNCSEDDRMKIKLEVNVIENRVFAEIRMLFRIPILRSFWFICSARRLVVQRATRVSNNISLVFFSFFVLIVFSF